MRKKITWKPGVQRADPLPRPHYPEEKLKPETEELLNSGALYVGAMCQLARDLSIEQADPKYVAPPFPVAVRLRYSGGGLSKGSIAVYTGMVRDEMQGKAGTIHVLQHTFMVNGGRYIIHPNNIKLVD